MFHKLIVYLSCFTFVYSRIISTNDDIESRVIYGQKATIQDHPYFAGLSTGCGASILSKRWLLTAAHCVDKSAYGTAYVGGATLYNSTQFKFNKVVIHPHYDDDDEHNNYLNDIALVRLARPLTFTKNIQPIKLPKTTMAQNYPLLLVARGTNENRRPSPSLMKLELEELSPEECLRYVALFFGPVWNGKQIVEEPRRMCTKRAGMDGPSGCQGDSGSPLVQNNVVVGVTSTITKTDCKRNPLTFFTRVACYVPWIQQVMGSE